jgi:hypothetical protein
MNSPCELSGRGHKPNVEKRIVGSGDAIRGRRIVGVDCRLSGGCPVTIMLEHVQRHII